MFANLLILSLSQALLLFFCGSNLKVYFFLFDLNVYSVAEMSGKN